MATGGTPVRWLLRKVLVLVIIADALYQTPNRTPNQHLILHNSDCNIATKAEMQFTHHSQE